MYSKSTKDRFRGHKEGMLAKFAEKVSEYIQANLEATINYRLYAGDEIAFILTVVTLLMKLVPKDIEQAAELEFMDASSNTEAPNLKVFLVCRGIAMQPYYKR